MSRNPRANCVIVIPELKKAAFVFGGKYGRGFASCRHGAGFGAPAAIRIEGGSFGLQLGGSSTDVVLLVMNQTGMDKLMGDKFTLGAEAAIAAGPVGRETSANTDVRMNAEIPSWSRSRGCVRRTLAGRRHATAGQRREREVVRTSDPES